MTIDVPLLKSVDVLILGGSTGAVAAALAARAKGSGVCCVSGYTYLGEDVCAHFRYWPEAAAEAGAEADLFARLFPAGREAIPNPGAVKRALESALIEADVGFLFMSHPICLLRDDKGQVAGAVVANRSGFQAVRAKVVIDATERAQLARSGGAPFRPFVPGEYLAERIVAGGAPEAAGGMTVEKLPLPVVVNERSLEAWRCRAAVPMDAATPMAFAEAETRMRLTTWHPDQLVASDRIRLNLPDRLQAGATIRGAVAPDTDLGAFRVPGLFVLGPMADLDDEAAASLGEPAVLLALGRRIGAAAADEAGAVRLEGGLRTRLGAERIEEMDIRRQDRYFRADAEETVALDLNALPLLARYDVVVAGGGTAGAPAGIAAGRKGARAVVLESTPSLGGIGTEGRIARYYHGNRCGFTTGIDEGVHAMGPEPEFAVDSGAWNTEWKKHWYLTQNHEAGTAVWFQTLVVAAGVRGNAVAGVVAVCPYGVGVLGAEAVVDASGSADVVAAAGGETITLGKAHVAVQGAGLSPFVPGNHCMNADYTFIDDNDVYDVTRAFVLARAKFRDLFDAAQIVNSRERRQIVGAFSLDPLDFLAQRTYPDTIVTARSDFDSHGFTVHPVFMAKSPNRGESLDAHVPYRCLLPKTLDGVLSTGLGVSAHRDAIPVVRMQPDVQNQGYAAGCAAATAARAGIALRRIDIKALQAHLVEKKILAPDVPDHVDNFPLPHAEVEKAAADGIENRLGLSILFAYPDKAVPLLKKHFAEAVEPARKLRYAFLLGLMRDDTGVEELVAATEASAWDEGWNFTGMGQFGISLSEVDTRLVALGRTGNVRGIPAMLSKLRTLEPGMAFSHFRACALAFEAQPAREAGPLFAALLRDERIRGRHLHDLPAMLRDIPGEWNDTSERNRELTEIVLARGLLACGDVDGLARQVLENYSRDLHGHYARHARALLGAPIAASA